MLAYAARYWLPVDTAGRGGRSARRSACSRAILAREPHDATSALEHALRRHPRRPNSTVERVPVQDYDTLRPYIERQRSTGAAALTTEAPLFYAQTSGSTGTPKYIPITAVDAAHPSRRAGAVHLPAVSRLPGGVCRQGARHHGRGRRGPARFRPSRSARSRDISTNRFLASVRARFVLPPARVGDRRLRPQVPGDSPAGARVSRTSRIMGSPNPSTFLRLLDILNDRRDELARSLETGSFARARCARRAIREQSSAPALRADPGARVAAARDGAAHVREPLAGHQARHDLDGRQLRHRARQTAPDAAGRRQGDGARLSVDRVPGHHRARSRDTRRAAAASSSFLRVRRAGRLGQRPARVPGSRRTGGRPALLHRHHDRGRAVPLLHERPRRGHRVSIAGRRCCDSCRRARASRA